MIENRNHIIPLEAIFSFLGERLLAFYGDASGCTIDNLADVEHVNENSLDWINPSRGDKQRMVENSKAKVLLVDESIKPVAGKLLLVVANPKVALAEIGHRFFVPKPEPGIHPSAVIHPEASLGTRVSIGPYCVIGRAEIGDGCVLDSHIRVEDGVCLGARCVVKAGAVLGSAGFGFERDEQGNLFRFPQLGQLILGDDVEVGANTCIDRGALSDTIIGSYTKINNLCHIAHNNVIGRNVVIGSEVSLSGSNTIGDDVWIAPHVSVRGWLHIGDRATLGMGAVVLKDVPSGETWVGNPARKLEK